MSFGSELTRESLLITSNESKVWNSEFIMCIYDERGGGDKDGEGGGGGGGGEDGSSREESEVDMNTK